YSKNVASGEAEDGDYIALGWDKEPKVVTAIKDLVSYDKTYGTSYNQKYYSYAVPAIVNGTWGFYAYGKTVIPDYDRGGTYIQTWPRGSEGAVRYTPYT